MAREAGAFANGTAGSFALNLSTVTNPTWIKIWTGGAFSGETTNARSAEGYADSNVQWAKAILVNSSGKFYKEYTDGTIVVVLTGSTPSVAVKASFTSFGTSVVNLNFSTASSSYTIFYEVGD